MSLPEAPLLHTSEGNIPLDSVRHAPAWEVTPEYIKFYDRYFLGDKLVKQSVHVYIPQGVSALAAQGAF